MHDFGARASAPWKSFFFLLKFLLKKCYKCRVGSKKSESRGVGWLIEPRSLLGGACTSPHAWASLAPASRASSRGPHTALLLRSTWQHVAPFFEKLSGCKYTELSRHRQRATDARRVAARDVASRERQCTKERPWAVAAFTSSVGGAAVGTNVGPHGVTACTRSWVAANSQSCPRNERNDYRSVLRWQDCVAVQ